MSIAKALKSVANSGRVVACVIHQPSSQLFASADDAILLANGRTLYSGAIENIPELLRKSGFLCPQYYNMADYSKFIITLTFNRYIFLFYYSITHKRQSWRRRTSVRV